jgi:uncharacterized radical SAM superfamily Fe-S cluster-containing enzyme
VRKAAPYVFHSQTTSTCETCLEPVPAKVILENERVYTSSAAAATACKRP